MTTTIMADRIAGKREENEQVARKLGRRLRARQADIRGKVISKPRIENGRDDEDACAFNIDVNGSKYSVLIWSKKRAKENWALKAKFEVKRGDIVSVSGFLSIYTLPRQGTSAIRVKAKRYRIVEEESNSFVKGRIRRRFYDAQPVSGSVVEVRIDAGREASDASSRAERLDRFMAEGAAGAWLLNEMTAGDPIQAEGELYISRISDGDIEYAFAEIPATKRVKSGLGLI